MATSVVFPRVQFFANNGRPLIGGRIHTYVAGSSTRAPTYKDAARTQPNANPIILDGRGEASIYLDIGVEYKFVVEDSKGALLLTQDPVYGAIWPDAASWPSDATLAYQYMLEAKAAAGAIGPIKFYSTYAQALTDIANIPIDGLIEIAQDETHGGARTRYKASGATLDFVVNLDQVRLDMAMPSGSSMIGFLQHGAEAIARTVQEKFFDLDINPRDFGAVCDGVTDDTNSVRSAHQAANLFSREVSYEGIEKIAISADANIPVKTSVNFSNSEIVILGGVNSSPSFNTFNTLYIVSDSDAPVISTTGSVSASNLTEGSLFPTLGLFDGHGFALLTAGLQVPDRAKTGTMNYTQAFKVNRNGRCSQPLSADLTAYAAAISVDYRKTSKSRLTISGFTTTEGSWNNQRLFRIERCNVEIDGLSVPFTRTDTFDNICSLVSIYRASDITINGYVTSGRPVSVSTGSYCLEIDGGADIYVNGMNALTGWGSVGANNVNGLHFSKSVVNRIDAHSSGHNIFAGDCDLHENGVVYGWGGGIIKVSNSRVHRSSAISSRVDYGGSFFGTLSVSDTELENNFSSTLTVIDLASNPLGASSSVYAPKAITTDNVKRTGRASATSNAEFIPIQFRIRQASDVVYAPILISATNTKCTFGSWRFGLRLDLLNVESNPQGANTRILIDGAHATSVAAAASGTLTSGVIDFDRVRTPTSQVVPFLNAVNGENLAFRIRTPANYRAKVINVALNAFEVDLSSAVQPQISIDACRLFNPVSGLSIPVGGKISGSSGYTVFRNIDISASSFDLSNAAALSGVTIPSGATQPTLPPGVTKSQAFTGWQSASAPWN